MYTSTSYTPTSPHPLVRRLLYPILLLSTPLFPILLFAPVYCSLLLSFATVEFGCIRLLSLTIVLTSSSFYIFCVNDRSSRFVHDLLEGFEFLEGVRRYFTVTDDHFNNSNTNSDSNSNTFIIDNNDIDDSALLSPVKSLNPPPPSPSSPSSSLSQTIKFGVRTLSTLLQVLSSKTSPQQVILILFFFVSIFNPSH